MRQGKRSGGPQTSEGKLASSQNSLKLGVYSRKVTLINESEDEFNQLLEQFMVDFAPRDIAESVLVRDLAIITWKRLRLEGLEQSSLVRALNEPITAAEYSRNGIEIDSGTVWTIEHLDDLTEGGVEYYERAIEEAKSWWASYRGDQDILSMQVNYPALFHVIIVRARVFGLDVSSDPDSEEVCSWALDSQKFGCDRYADYVARALIREDRELNWVEENSEQIKLAAIKVKEERLLRVMQSPMKPRVHDDLSRSLYKTLSELRRHQQWRRKMSIVDVTPSEPKAT
jgi:hypothetical protein